MVRETVQFRIENDDGYKELTRKVELLGEQSNLL